MELVCPLSTFKLTNFLSYYLMTIWFRISLGICTWKYGIRHLYKAVTLNLQYLTIRTLSQHQLYEQPHDLFKLASSFQWITLNHRKPSLTTISILSSPEANARCAYWPKEAPFNLNNAFFIHGKHQSFKVRCARGSMVWKP